MRYPPPRFGKPLVNLLAVAFFVGVAALLLFTVARPPDLLNDRTGPSGDNVPPGQPPQIAPVTVTAGVTPTATIAITATPRPTRPFPPTETPPPSATPIVDRGVRVGPPQEVSPFVRPWEESIFQDFDLDASQLIWLYLTPGQRDPDITLYAADLDKGTVITITTASQAPDPSNPSVLTRSYITEPKIESPYVAWITGFSHESAADTREIHLYDLTSGQDLVVSGQGYLNGLDAKEHLLLWEAVMAAPPNGVRSEIQGYDIDTRQGFTMTLENQLNRYPRICSRSWITYLTNYQKEAETYDIHAHQLNTGEDIYIGQLPYPSVYRTGSQFDCDGERVVRVVVSEHRLEYRLYDLTTRTEQIIPMPMTGFSLPFVKIIRNTILTDWAGYDLERGVVFALPDHAAIPVLLSHTGDRVLWAKPTGENVPGESRLLRLYTAPIIRDSH